MEKKEYHISFRIATLLIAFIMVLPSVVKLSHAITHDHQHEVCIEKNQTHFHKVDFDCEFYKFKINQNLFFEFTNYNIESSSYTNTSETAYYTYLKSHKQLTSFLRGPPHLM
ncbi:hypothetical protein [Psychroserpens algicola]|uniref:Uncharacterized protein n=1 Tax=Psychroserpens algicola TaxID=1719034 RepID=A0ABT0H8I4_9FLAO|nr:hypothetical protein [Psychroserpens algicola]MCK8480675.1 hypothetical protein [Psychroserpens algicola]